MTITLYGTATSPYVNKVRIAAQVLGIWEEMCSIGVDLSAPPPEFCVATSLRQIPVLVESDGLVISDSTIICQYLDTCSGGGHLLPVAEPKRIRRLMLATLCNSLIDTGAGLRRERLRPEVQQSDVVASRLLATMARVMDYLEETIDTLGPDPDLASVTLVAALDWIELRHGHHELIQSRPALAKWLAAAKEGWVPPVPSGAFIIPST